MSRLINRIITAQDAPLTPTMTVKRVFPNASFKNIDPFVFLDHFGPAFHRAGASAFEEGTGAHPHRGFITFTYLFDGDMEHKDSRGNHSIVASGGAQWMKAASGIIHDEKPSKAFLQRGGIMHGLQLWINLPARFKNDPPQYQSLPNDEVPEVELPNGSLLRVLIGEYAQAASPIPTYSSMSVFHLILSSNATVELPVSEGWNVAAYVPKGSIVAASERVNAGQLAVFNTSGSSILLTNPHIELQDVMLFAGQPIGEPIITYGPFVMDTLAGVQIAYNDFQAGKYGEIRV